MVWLPKEEGYNFTALGTGISPANNLARGAGKAWREQAASATK